jgi:hypothetical protein
VTSYTTPTAVFDLFVDDELRDTVEADCRADANRQLGDRNEELRSIRFQGRTRITVREHECASGAMAYICCFCQAQLPSGI